MKKTILVLLALVVIVITIVCVKYYANVNEYNKILKENAEYEEYKEKEIYGIELATLINKTIDKNTKNENKEDYIPIEIDIYISDNETTYKMEIFYNAGMEQFIQYYGNIKFKCSNIQYAKSTKKIQYLLFEQI